MSDPVSNAKLYAAISAAMGEIEAIPKDRENTQQGYKYTSESAIANTIRPIMAKHGLSVLPLGSTVAFDDTVKTAKGGELRRIVLNVLYRIAHSSGEHIDCSMASEGLDNFDKSCQKAITAAYKYLLIQLFCIGRGEDGDAGEGLEGDAPKSENSAVRAASRNAESAPNRPLSGTYTLHFGKHKGKALSEVDSDYLKWLMGSTEDAIKDPAKASYKGANKSLLDSILSELNTRAKNADADEPPHSIADLDGLPF